MTNYDRDKGTSFNEGKVDRDTEAVRGNINWIVIAVVIVVAALAGFEFFTPHSSSDTVANNPAPMSDQPTTGRSVAPAAAPGIDTTAPAH